MSEEIAEALMNVLTSPNVSDSNMEPANLVDVFDRGIASISERLGTIGTWLKYLGAGENGSQMGAVEFHGVCVKEAADVIAEAIRDLSESIREHNRES